MEKTRPNTPLADALGKGGAVTFKGRTWDLEPLDLNDFCDIEERIKGGVDALDPFNPVHQRVILHLVLRKADPDLSAADAEACRYRLTEQQVGRMLKAGDLKKPETLQFILHVMTRSGLFDTDVDGAAAESGNV